MGGDISDSAKLGVGVLILCFLMGIIFNLFTITRNVTTKSSNQLQSSFNTIADSAYATYDNTTVFGSQVLNAITTYAAEKMSIVVCNGTGFTGNLVCQKLNTAGETSCSGGYGYYYGYALKTSAGPTITKSGNYCIGTLNLSESAKNNSSSATKTLGMRGTYINESNRYDSHLIKDSTGLVIGIVFNLRGD